MMCVLCMHFSCVCFCVCSVPGLRLRVLNVFVCSVCGLKKCDGEWFVLL